MSAAEDSSNLSPDPADVYDDELFRWLQYPLDDDFEKNYCSDFYGGSMTSPDAVALKTRPAPNVPAGSLSDMAKSAGTGRGLPIKKDVGTKSLIAEDALALGAARAAGHSSQVGHDAFSKVRTSWQPQEVITSPCYSLNAFNYKDCSPFEPKLPVPQTILRLSQDPTSRMANSGFTEKSKRFPTASTVRASEKAGMVKGTYSQQLSNTQQSRLSQITEEDSNGKDANSRSTPAPRTGIARMEGLMMTSSNSWNMKDKMRWAEKTSETPTSYSGGSQISMSLSFREMTHSGKRKHEDSELQSQDADDKMRNTEVPRKFGSRRNRVSEVHNLSERNRRNRINEKLKALQDLIPNSSKTDKASVLDEAIEYMKTLQTQLQVVSMRNSMNMMPMMMPMAFPLTSMHMAPLHPIGLGVPVGHAAMGMGVGVDSEFTTQCHFLSAPASMSNYGMHFKNGSTASLQDGNHSCTNVDLLSTHPLASMHKIHEPSEQEQQRGYSSFNHKHEQQDGLSD